MNKFRRFWRLFAMAVRGEEENFTEGGVDRALFLLAIPMILEMAMESLFAICDLFFVSLLKSNDAIATIGLTENFMFIVMSIALGISMPATAMVARRIGEKNHEAAAKAGVQAIGLAIAVAVVLGVVGFIFAEDFLRFMGASEALISEGLSYTRIVLTFNFVLILLFVINAIFRGAGNASIAMRTLWLANGLNIILDPCLIFGLGPFPELGLKGAAIATCTGRGVGVLYQIWHLVNGKSLIRIAAHHLKIQWQIVRDLFRLSIGGAGQHLITTASWIFMSAIITTISNDAFAGYTAAIRIIMFTLLPSWGLAMAAATLVGQNLGAGKPDRAEISVWKAARYNMFFLASLSVIFLLLARPVIELFVQEEMAVKYGSLALKIICTGYIFYAYEMVIGQAFNGAGDTFTPTLLNFICFWVIMIPMAYTLAKPVGWGPVGVFTSIAVCSSILAILAVFVFRRGKWKTVKI